MKKFTANYLRLKHFICFREAEEIIFDSLSNIVSIEGENRDAKNPDSQVKSSNGSGKSTIPEAVYYAIYGKPIKKFGKIGSIIHNLTPGATAEVEFIFNNIYRILRTQKEKGGTVRLWKSDKREWNKETEITLSTKPETDKLIQELVGLTPEAFENISLFSDDQKGCFLQCDTPTKREIVEALLSLQIYRERQEKANQFVSESKSNIKGLKQEYSILSNTAADCKTAYQNTVTKDLQWKENLKLEIAALINKIKVKKVELESSDNGAELLLYQAAQERIPLLNKEITELEEKNGLLKQKIETSGVLIDDNRRSLKDLTDKLSEYKSRVASNASEVKKLKDHISDLQSNTHGTKCNQCYGLVDFSNIEPLIEADQKKIVEYTEASLNDEQSAKVLFEEGRSQKAVIESLEAQKKLDEAAYRADEIKLRTLKTDLARDLGIREPEIDSKELLLKTEIDQITLEAKQKREQYNSGTTPFTDLITSSKERAEKAELQLAAKEAEVAEVESNIPYYEYWRTGFGDKGIRQSIIEEIIPVLNQRIAYWLQPLVSNTITLNFNSNLEETIERNPPDGDPYVYSAMSAGQRRRLNLAVSQAFADIMAATNGITPSLVFLDEVTTNIDPTGVQGIYAMIQELSKEKQVFVTTHDHDLLDMLESADTIKLIHEDGRTTISKK